ncbi:MAG TPA: fused MFS/spermidine synthase [Bryobacteraceae bacterium]|nr:fused MFS/spermidine synthase [Bryobacteraceae bacterium]
MPVYAATIFLSAFLLFQVQPLIAKFILPWFGGSAAVWSAALLFFQLVLLAGYFYAHLLIRYLKPRHQFYVHVVLLAASLATLPIVPSAIWKTTDVGDPTFRILLLLAATVGLPYAILSATSPLLQAWYVRTHEGAIPYRLFALSNFGSMLALLSYPTLVEPRLTLHSQAVIWSWGFAAFAIACGVAAWKSRAGAGPLPSAPDDNGAAAPPLGEKLLWIGLAACASILLLAVTTYMTQNVAPIPLLWVVPLSLYLLSFILCFESDRLYPRWLFLPLLAVALGLFTYGITWYEDNTTVRRLIPALCGALFVCCMVCHGELSRRRPHPRFLTQFYLMVSVGGALGGLFVAFVSPRIFHDYVELLVALVGCAILVTRVLWNQASGIPRPLWMRAVLMMATAGFAGYLGYSQFKRDRIYVRSARNFYGVLHVRDDKDGAYDAPAERVLVHGTIDHGTQLARPGSERIPTSYFGSGSGISRALHALHDMRGHLRIGILGLGAGVTATLANPGDTLHYYEINPLILDIATHEFGFLNACPADKQVLMGDARLVLEALPSERLDLLAMDAFSSDAIPVHLLTREAYRTYLRHLKPDGVLVVHISNRYLDLEPVVSQAMADMGWSGVKVEDDGEEQPYYSGSTWTVLNRDAKFFEHPSFKSAGTYALKTKPGFHGWTDDFSNLITILR